MIFKEGLKANLCGQVPLNSTLKNGTMVQSQCFAKPQNTLNCQRREYNLIWQKINALKICGKDESFLNFILSNSFLCTSYPEMMLLKL